jgi:hypothetical protein
MQRNLTLAMASFGILTTLTGLARLGSHHIARCVMRSSPNALLRLTSVLFTILSPTAFASARYVSAVTGSNNNNCLSVTTACKTIGHAISLAASGDTIVVAAATYIENLTIGKNLTVVGASANTTVVDGAASNTVVKVSGGVHVTLSRLTIRNGQANPGAGINNSGTLTVSNSAVTGNWAPIPCIHSFLFCEIFGGKASGGGIYNTGVLTISNSTISGNHAGGYCNASCSAFGGGIYNAGTLVVIKNSTITGNGVSKRCSSTSTFCEPGEGGAIYTSGNTVRLNNSTVNGNSAYYCAAVCAGLGGAIFNASGNLALNNTTVSGNPNGGLLNTGTATLQNSILANNSVSNCGDNAIISVGYNLSSDKTCNFNGPGDMNNLNPLLGGLANNGGPTQTMALLEGSPAIDAGNPSGCTDGSGHLLMTDQRGQPRPDKEDIGGCDIGAYEKQSD